MVSSSIFIFEIQLLPLLYIQTKYTGKKEILTFSVNWCTTTDWYVKVVASTTSLLRICMYVFLERERREKRRQIFAQFGGNACYWLVVWSRKKERERSIYFTAIIHWLSDRKKNGKESTDADDMFFYIRSSFLFLPLFLFFLYTWV